MQVKLTEVIKQAEEDEDIKCIMLHGGKYFTSGNDIGVFKKMATEYEETMEYAYKGACVIMPNLIMTLAAIKKPIIAVVRGGCIGIGFTALGHVSMIYCTPEATFNTPFMESSQSPEGNSTM